ncbi:MAG: DUF86 domain-containing protein [Hyphomicrobiales bacterium]
MRRNPLVVLWDARNSAQTIGRFLAGKAIEDYLADDLIRSAVERQFEILGEALARLARYHPEIAARIPDLRQAIGFRNVLSHGYDIVDPVRVWEAARDDLPALLANLSALITELDPAGSGD